MSPSTGVGLEIDKHPTILKHRQDSIHGKSSTYGSNAPRTTIHCEGSFVVISNSRTSVKETKSHHP